ncbi:GGDEF domain-containing protein [Brumicola pallidula]|uniref:GGDEF domain-containing protein n=1 Tax=Brumicola pallidula TaxID=56807 RepID=UPI001FD5B6E9|nr:GGDEF domain-containing protein [Glaciecola pallidula]
MNIRCLLLLPLIFFALDTNAQETDQVDQFIKDVKVKTYDCPSGDMIPQLEEYLANTDISKSQRFQLQLEKTQWQICNGNYSEAEMTVDAIIANPIAEQLKEYYAFAVYQKGFLFDVKEDNRRCDFYRQAKELSLGKFDDISLSSELGLMTYCEAGINEGQKLKRLFNILEFYSLRGEASTVAHIHNNIGLLYGRIGQHVLAAEQYQKTYEIGFSHYQGTNKYATLISAFTSLLASDQYAEAELVINELDNARSELDVPLMHAWYYYAKARFYHRLNRFDELAQTVIDWEPHLVTMQNTIYSSMYHWFEIEVCVDQRQIECIQRFVLEEESGGPKALSFLGRNVDYLTLRAKAYLELGELEKSREYWSAFSTELRAKLASNQSSGKVLGVANMYNEIGVLENTLKREQRNRDRITVGSIIVFMLATLLVVIMWRKKLAEASSYDSVTTLLKSRAAISKITKVVAPSENKTNALALFDLANFKEVNRLLGSSNADDAIQKIAQTFKSITRGSDILGRFAPEQFILCLPDIEEEGAKALFERIRLALENTNLGDHKGIKIKIRSNMSIYITSSTLDDLDEVLDDMMLSLSMKSEKA